MHLLWTGSGHQGLITGGNRQTITQVTDKRDRKSDSTVFTVSLRAPQKLSFEIRWTWFSFAGASVWTAKRGEKAPWIPRHSNLKSPGACIYISICICIIFVFVLFLYIASLRIPWHSNLKSPGAYNHDNSVYHIMITAFLCQFILPLICFACRILSKLSHEICLTGSV